MSLDYSKIYISFESSMRALYTLNETVVKITEDEDLSVLSEFYSELTSFFPEFIDEEEVFEILSRFIKLDEEEDILRPKEILEELGLDFPEEYISDNGVSFNTQLFAEHMRDWWERDADSFSIFLRAMYKVTRDAPIRSELLRRGILLSLISIFDDLLGHLVENTSDLELFSKWKEKRWKKNEHPTFIGKKVLYLKNSNKYGTIDFVNFLFPSLEEVIERRNVFTHSNGLVDGKYIRIAGEYAKRKGLQSGERLRLSKNYMHKSLNLIYVLGLILIQTAWRKADDSIESLEEADKKIILSQKLTLQDARFETAKQISEWGDSVIRRETSLLPKQDRLDDGYKLRRRRYVFLLNYAMAFRELGKAYEMEKIIRKIKHPEWSSSIRSAIAILHGKNGLGLQYLEDAVIHESAVHDLFLDDSPIFQYVANMPDYARIRDLAKKNFG